MQVKFGLPSIGGVVILLLDWKSRYDVGESVVSGVAGHLPTWAYPLALIVGLGLIVWDVCREKKEITVMISPIVLAITLSVMTAIAWGWFVYDRSQGPVEWTFDNGSPLSWQRVVQGAPS